ncbi:hypothetical protein PGC35_20275 [Psychrobacillus sp. PGGUH221]|uniref:hypothetical protein n=1 Tax=Psychrobacillus sp. PGGUH221 TaxID=3020058 RepID=UPI0035C6C508
MRQQVLNKELIFSDEKSNLFSKVESLGLLNKMFGGIQIDVNAALKKNNNELFEAHMCDHNCTIKWNGVETGGNYDCPAAFSQNLGINKKTIATGELIVKAVEKVANSIKDLKHDFILNKLDSYGKEFNVPAQVLEVYKDFIDCDDIEVALFGGSPEIHSDILWMIEELKSKGYIVTVTMTGRRLMLQPSFVEKLMENPPHVIALSADDFDGIEQIEHISNLSLEEIKAEWAKIPKQFGQRQKAYEAIYTIKLREQYGDRYPKLLLNIALHDQNLVNVSEFITRLSKCLPDVALNPFPVQSGFMYSPSPLSIEGIEYLNNFVDEIIESHFIEETKNNKYSAIVPRLHYWLMLKSALVRWRDTNKASDVISGDGFWRCYQGIGSGRYIQITSSDIVDNNQKVGGGCLSCFWNKSVADSRGKVWDLSKDDVTSYILTERESEIQKASMPCPGCAFPRLVFDVISGEVGLDKSLLDDYLKLRKKYVGY